MLTFRARPPLLRPPTGLGVGNPHINAGSADPWTLRGGGAPTAPRRLGHRTGNLADARAAIAKTPDAGAATAGATSNSPVQSTTRRGHRAQRQVTDVSACRCGLHRGPATAIRHGIHEGLGDRRPGPGQPRSCGTSHRSTRRGVPSPFRSARGEPRGRHDPDQQRLGALDELPLRSPITEALGARAPTSRLRIPPSRPGHGRETIDYVLRAPNAGPSDALGSSSSDVLPANVTSFLPPSRPAPTPTAPSPAASARSRRALSASSTSGCGGSRAPPATSSTLPRDSDRPIRLLGQRRHRHDDDRRDAGLRIDKSTPPRLHPGRTDHLRHRRHQRRPVRRRGLDRQPTCFRRGQLRVGHADHGSCSQAAGIVTCALRDRGGLREHRARRERRR